MKIKSISDVITNSSSEVFIINLSDPLYGELRKITEFKELPNLEAVRDIVLSKSYSSWDLDFGGSNGDVEVGNPDYVPPRYDVFDHYSDIERTPENWEKYKDLYKGVLGVAIQTLENDSEEYRKIKEILHRDYLEKNIYPVIEKLIPGKRYSGSLKTDKEIKASFVWTGEEKVTVEGPKFNSFTADIVTLLELIELD